MIQECSRQDQHTKFHPPPTIQRKSRKEPIINLAKLVGGFNLYGKDQSTNQPFQIFLVFWCCCYSKAVPARCVKPRMDSTWDLMDHVDYRYALSAFLNAKITNPSDHCSACGIYNVSELEPCIWHNICNTLGLVLCSLHGIYKVLELEFGILHSICHGLELEQLVLQPTYLCIYVSMHLCIYASMYLFIYIRLYVWS